MLLNIYTSTLLLLAAVTPSSSFSPSNFPSTQRSYSTQSLALFNLGGSSAGGTAKIPSSPNDRDKQAINAVKAAIQKPRDPQCPLIECEFPALAALNKLGDGSLRSALEAEDANIAFAKKLVNGIAPLPFGGPEVSVIMSTSASGSFTKKAKAGVKGAKLYALREGVPEVRKGGVCIFVTPCSQKDYQTAKSLAQSGCPTVVLNGFAKDPKSIDGSATMAYFFKPLTYNSQVVGFLIRSYPGLWTVLDAETKSVLKSFSDEEILVRNTNTPDLRESGKLVQRSVDERAIRARGK